MEGRGARGRRGAGGGWLATLMGALLLMVAGFAVGLVAGILFEEPDLVIDQIAGRATEVPLPADADPEQPGAPDVAAPPVAIAPPASPPGQGAAAQPEPEPEPALTQPAAAIPEPPEPPPVSAPPPRSGYAVQVGAYGDQGGARRLVDELEEAGFAVYVSTSEAKGARYRVRVGPVASRDEARRLAARLEREQKLKTWVLSEAGP
jgi:DedD protein